MSASAPARWRAGLLAAGCLERLAPYLRACGVPREIRYYRDGVDRLWAGHGVLTPVDAESLAAVGAKLQFLRDMYSIQAQILDLLVMAARAARQPATGPVERLDAALGEAAATTWSEIGGADWGEREAHAQQETLTMLGSDPAASAARIRVVAVRRGQRWTAELAEHDGLRVDPDRDRYTPPTAVPDLAYRAGDVVEVWCPWTPTVVTRRSQYDVAVRWPWAVLDPESKYRPSDSWAFPIDESSEPWLPYVLRPPVAELAEGDPCAVGVPRSRCYLVRAARHDPPIDDGSLPRMAASVALLPVGSGYVDAAAMSLERNEALELSLLHRPYPALMSGDEVDDADGRRLRFVAPFVFFAADGARVRPAWPLILVSLGGSAADREAVRAVAAATTDGGGHVNEIERWRACSEVPYPATAAEEVFDDS